MNRIFLLALLALSACTVEPMSANPEPQFHMPFTYGRWEAKPTPEGSCVVTSGYRGVLVEKTALGVRVVSTSTIGQGERLILTVNGHRYQTSDTAFAAEDAQAIVDDFIAGDKAYLRLRKRGTSSHGFINSDNIIKLDGFAKAFKQCNVKKSKKKS